MVYLVSSFFVFALVEPGLLFAIPLLLGTTRFFCAFFFFNHQGGTPHPPPRCSLPKDFPEFLLAIFFPKEKCRWFNF